MIRTRVLTTLWLFVGLAHCFSWDIVVGGGKQLKFYNMGILMHTENVPSADRITSVTYDPVHYRVLFAERRETLQQMSISSFDLTTMKIQTLVTRKLGAHVRVVYDPITQLLLSKKGSRIYSWSMIPASSNKTVDEIYENLLVTSDNYIFDIAIDSCGGYIYWITDYKIERAAFDGSEREVLIENDIYRRQSLAIDQQTQKMYWIENKFVNSHNHLSIQMADLNGKNNRTFYFIGETKTLGANSLAVSKDFIFWKSYDQRAILQLPKNRQHNEEPTVYTIPSESSHYLQLTAANYTIMEQTLGLKSCEALKSLISNSSVPVSSDERLLDIPGTKVSGKPRCECTQNYTGERFDVLNCENYCFQGNCSFNAEGQPECSCEAGYSGERCEVNQCYQYCLNKGDCSLNEEDKPVCECTAGYEGERCDVATTRVHDDNRTQQVPRDLGSEVRQVIKEEQRRFLYFLSDKINEYEVKN